MNQLTHQVPELEDETYEGGITFGHQASTDKMSRRDKRATGLVDFIYRSELEDESKGWKVNDRVMIRATITTYGHLESTVTAGPAAAVFTPPESWRSDMRALLSAGRAADIALYCGPREFAAHRTILRARSQYFEALFSSRWSDANRYGW